jgi:hypothetical protein
LRYFAAVRDLPVAGIAGRVAAVFKTAASNYMSWADVPDAAHLGAYRARDETV